MKFQTNILTWAFILQIIFFSNFNTRKEKLKSTESKQVHILKIQISVIIEVIKSSVNDHLQDLAPSKNIF